MVAKLFKDKQVHSNIKTSIDKHENGGFVLQTSQHYFNIFRMNLRDQFFFPRHPRLKEKKIDHKSMFYVCTTYREATSIKFVNISRLYRATHIWKISVIVRWRVPTPAIQELVPSKGVLEMDLNAVTKRYQIKILPCIMFYLCRKIN